MLCQAVDLPGAEPAICQVVAPAHRILSEILQEARQAHVARVAPADNDARAWEQHCDLAQTQDVVGQFVGDPQGIAVQGTLASQMRRCLATDGEPVPFDGGPSDSVAAESAEDAEDVALLAAAEHRWVTGGDLLDQAGPRPGHADDKHRQVRPISYAGRCREQVRVERGDRPVHQIAQSFPIEPDATRTLFGLQQLVRSDVSGERAIFVPVAVVGPREREGSGDPVPRRTRQIVQHSAGCVRCLVALRLSAHGNQVVQRACRVRIDCQCASVSIGRSVDRTLRGLAIAQQQPQVGTVRRGPQQAAAHRGCLGDVAFASNASYKTVLHKRMSGRRSIRLTIRRERLPVAAAFGQRLSQPDQRVQGEFGI